MNHLFLNLYLLLQQTVADLEIKKTNTSVANSLGTYLLSQISLIFLDMLNVYRMYSELISSSIAEGVPFASKTSYVKLLWSGKKETTESETNTIDGAIANLTFDKMDMNVRDFPVCHTRQL
ncbi:hypothetical protein ES319_A02G150700v1 [Gossypium barbadense]|uniref:Exportin-1 C-terminal domain-containing protein n=1 Tax=Gossypium barbadense TaxID=3634 RepID=A0A5J5WPS1_GOSBA|nr:hypothetical protein ES319_A02G150700v1 [Gossypium barbadense]